MTHNIKLRKASPSGYVVDRTRNCDEVIDTYYRGPTDPQVIDDHASKFLEVWRGRRVERMPKDEETAHWFWNLLGF